MRQYEGEGIQGAVCGQIERSRNKEEIWIMHQGFHRKQNEVKGLGRIET
jgi:hypothetical protein